MSRLVATVARAPASRLEPRRRAVAPSPGSTSPVHRGFHVVLDPSRPAARPPPRSSRRSVGAARGRCGRTPTTPMVAAMREDSFDLGSYDPEMDGYEPPEVSVSDVVKGARIGEGSFAVVHAGTVAGVGDVVLKQYRRDVRGRDWFSFYADERAMCRRLRDRPGVAPFVGVAGSDLYLVWRDVGKRTLANVMEEAQACAAGKSGDVLHDALTLAASEMGLTTAGKEGGSTAAGEEGGLTDSEVFVAVARGLIEAVVSINDADVVHRDVKPDNVLLTSPEKGSPGGARVLMVDLGGAADYQTGQGTDGSEAIFDPTYGAPEQFKRVKSRSRGVAGMFAGFGVNRDVDVSGIGDLEATGAAPTAAFDAFGVGLTLLRLATPALHPATSMKLARSAMDEAADRVSEREGKGDEGGSVLDEWASGPGSGSCDFGLLDELGAWSLLEGLTQWDPDRRMTLEEALRHPSLN